MRMSIQGDIRAVQRDLGRLQKRDVPKATRAALNRTQTQLVTQVRRAISKAKKIQQKALKGRVVRLARATLHNMVAELELRYQPVPASRLRPRQTKKGVRAGQWSFPGAFLVPPTARRAANQVMERTGKKRLPIVKQTVPLEPEAQKVAKDVVKKRGREIFRHNFDRQVKRYLAKRR